MKKIKIRFCDLPPEFNRKDNFILSALKMRYDVEISDKPDFIFYSVFSVEHFQYRNCVKIFLGGEPVVPNFNDCDYAIGYIYLDFGDRYLRVANMLANSVGIGTNPSIQERKLVEPSMFDRRFCNFIYSNDTRGDGALLRKDFCKKLMKYKLVDCPGKILHNMDASELEERFVENKDNKIIVKDNNWQESKIKFLKKYKFTIAFENLSIPGMTTEKLLNPLQAYSIPIYWGNPLVTKEFNSKAFINCNDFDNNFDQVIQRIKELDENKNEYLAMLRERPFQSDYLFDDVQKFHDFLYMIIERGNHPVRHPEAAECWEPVSALLVYRWGHSYESVKALSEVYNSGLWDAFQKFRVIASSPIYKPLKKIWKKSQRIKQFLKRKMGK